MHISNINDAKTHLSRLIKLALAGDEVIIARANEPLVRLTPIQQLDTSPRVGGFWAGKVQYPVEWDVSDAEIATLFDSSEIFPSEEA
jgi:prevent-host-death family protein